MNQQEKNQAILDIFDSDSDSRDLNNPLADYKAEFARQNINQESDDPLADYKTESAVKTPTRPPLSAADKAKYARDIEVTGAIADPLKYIMGKAKDVALGYPEQLGSGLQSAEDLLTGNTSWTKPTSQTNALAANQNPKLSDYSNALLSQVAQSPGGKFANVVASVIPGYNIAGNVVNKLINPAVENVTGVDPANLQAGELIGGTAIGAKYAPKASGKNIIDQFKSAIPDNSPAVDSDTIKELSQEKYKQAEDSGAVLSPTKNDAWLDNNKSILPKTERGKGSDSSPVDDFIAEQEQYRGKPLTLQEAMEIDERLGDKIQSEIRPNGSITNAGRQFQQIQQGLRDTIRNAKPEDITGGQDGFAAWREGQQLWSQHLKLRDVEAIERNAELSPNPIQARQAGFRNLVKNGKKTNGWTDDELSAATSAAKTGIGTEITKLLASRLNPIIAGSVGGFPGAAAAYAVSEGARAIGGKAASVRSNSVQNAILNHPAVQKAMTNKLINQYPSLVTGYINNLMRDSGRFPVALPSGATTSEPVNNTQNNP